MRSFQPVGSGWSTVALIVRLDPGATGGAVGCVCALVAVLVAIPAVVFTVRVSLVGSVTLAFGRMTRNTFSPVPSTTLVEISLNLLRPSGAVTRACRPAVMSLLGISQNDSPLGFVQAVT